ncbi:hypothetical protein RCL_jg19929.t1 [Rhizophagus clarus]|uniref:Transposase Tc1-like domain-containing protein n=1 Tax=Rhizophagus clarus TaxID=94130 RepID=A0A8H3QKR9_9GLOM|nr:hypothetical protein RCL_jg19929.t1 [Rhizophagus clarus]
MTNNRTKSSSNSIKYEETNSISDKSKTGKSHKLTDRDERIMVRRIMIDEYFTAVSIQKSLKIVDKIEVSENTVRRTLNRNGVGFLYKIDGGLDAELYQRILDEDFLDILEYYSLNHENIIFQQDNDSKYIAKRI